MNWITVYDGPGIGGSIRPSGKGGDEINLVTDGGNDGWPLVTYGADYDAFHWPLAAGRRDHGPYDEPVYKYVATREYD